MIKPRIVTKLITSNDKIEEMVIKDSVKKIGRSGYVALPKQLVGKYVEIKLKIVKKK